MKTIKTICLAIIIITALMVCLPLWAAETIIVSAEGLVDANAELYIKDKGLMVDDLRADARRQVIEKAVGVYVESSTLVENYQMISDRVLSKSKGVIKKVIKESPPWIGQDGLAHLLMKAEVYTAGVQDALKEMSRDERISLIKEYDNPKISVAITVRDAERGPDVRPERSAVAENILKERIKGFGYRVWSEEAVDSPGLAQETPDNTSPAPTSVSQVKASDFTICGEAKFKKLNATLQASGVTITKYVLTSYTVKCLDNNTGEEIYFNNKVPRKKSWADEDAAIEDIGTIIGSEFSKGFFEEHLQKPTRIFQLRVTGLPSYDVGEMLKKEFLGLRPILNVDFREFDKSGLSLYEVETSSQRGGFNSLINNVIIKPLNAKLGGEAFVFQSARGNVVEISLNSSQNPGNLETKLQETPPASMAEAPVERIKYIVKNQATAEKIAQINPMAASELKKGGLLGPDKAVDAVKEF